MQISDWYRKNKHKTRTEECSIIAAAFPENGKLLIQTADRKMDIMLSPAEMYELLMQLDNCCKRWTPIDSKEN